MDSRDSKTSLLHEFSFWSGQWQSHTTPWRFLISVRVTFGLAKGCGTKLCQRRILAEKKEILCDLFYRAGEKSEIFWVICFSVSKYSWIDEFMSQVVNNIGVSCCCRRLISWILCQLSKGSLIDMLIDRSHSPTESTGILGQGLLSERTI